VKKPPQHAPARIDSTAELRAFQRLMTAAVVRPLDAEDNLQSKWVDGRPMDQVAAEFIKPNDRLTSFERLQLYNQMYWYRVLEAVRDDCPGLRAAIGEPAFARLAKAYLAQCPSRSFTLRNLSSRLPDFIRAHPRLTAPRTALAIEVARFEWAQTVAFDGEARPVVAGADLAGTPPDRLRLGLQPYITLLDLRHPIDTFVISVKRRDVLRSEASNTPDSQVVARRSAIRVRRPRPVRTCVVVHRHHNRLFYKRLEPAAFRILAALDAGEPLARALLAGGPRVRPEKIRAWFTSWMALGWFCARGNKPSRRAS
jgi:hypothetical protein